MFKIFSGLLFVLLSVNSYASVRASNATNTVNFLSVNTTLTNPILLHNADIGVFPGETNSLARSFIPKNKFLSIPEDIIVSGIKAAAHGKKILVVATSGSITFLPNNTNSSNGNRIAYSGNMTIQQGDAFELTYNELIKKWVITNTNP
ncbi:hypothetical protein [Lacinutrix sp. MedPE-SW]|uniref:hypothetical protein n=1 Tax=Lacinutrix sp. MedPE-SW TaxID=1860087 RepID=UPI00091ACE2C|nr:hypothetical protein [Lacinutrix sp. MedPE-SW]OIQ22678.1 MAG: hypothetical protein BM549_06250 [Lacinutrix sp. MedPE-SW]